jgi:hypothetical protein
MIPDNPHGAAISLVAAFVRADGKIRNSKLEMRNKSEIQMTKIQNENKVEQR